MNAVAIARHIVALLENSSAEEALPRDSKWSRVIGGQNDEFALTYSESPEGIRAVSVGLIDPVSGNITRFVLAVGLLPTGSAVVAEFHRGDWVEKILAEKELTWTM